MSSLLDEQNPCGQTLLRIVSRGSSIIAELLRLSRNVPECLKGPEPYEQKINSDTVKWSARIVDTLPTPPAH